jgi:hypothetical protein
MFKTAKASKTEVAAQAHAAEQAQLHAERRATEFAKAKRCVCHTISYALTPHLMA